MSRKWLWAIRLTASAFTSSVLLTGCAAHPKPAAALASAPPPAAVVDRVQTAATGPHPRYGFGGAELGMPLSDWRKISSLEATSVCTPDPSSSRAIVCSTQDLPLGAAYAARHLSYRFFNGVLVEITFETSVDGFDHATAVLKKRFGEPTEIVRDTVRLQNGVVFPHVLMRWRNGRSTIALSDPAAKGVTLSVRFTLNARPDAPSKLE